MLFRHTRPTDAFQRALRAGVASHRPAALRALLASHGDRMFARALSDLSGRVIADALSMLPVPNRDGVRRHLARAARNRLHALDASGARTAPGPLRLTSAHRCMAMPTRAMAQTGE